MTTATPSLRRLTPQAAVLLLVAAVAWLATVGRAGAMRGMTGTMGLGLAAFVGMWAGYEMRSCSLSVLTQETAEPVVGRPAGIRGWEPFASILHLCAGTI